MKDDLETLAEQIAKTSDGVEALLDRAMDAIVAATRAERAFVVLVGEDMALSMRSARNIDGEAVQAPELKVSRTVIGEAIGTGQPILTAEAVGDERYSESDSIKRIEPLSILCVPLVAGGRTLGVLYLDNRFLPRLFRTEHRDRVVAFAAKIARPLERLIRKSPRRAQFAGMVGAAESMQRVYAMIEKVAAVEMPVVIYGESGTGKELVARAIHTHGPRAKGPFVAENCAAIAPTLIESELFGHVKGAFTGADREKPGLLEVACDGTLFLDEIGSMPLEMQSRLLRALQECEIRRVGGNRIIKINPRVLTASNQKLEELVKDGRFRQDLYYRLKVIEIVLPPLRERPEDIPALIEHFTAKFAGEAGGKVKSISAEARGALQSHRWPGNVRELENEVRRAMALSDDAIELTHLSPELARPHSPGLTGTLAEIERNAIVAAIAQAKGNKKKAAKQLGLPRTTLYSKMKLLGLE